MSSFVRFVVLAVACVLIPAAASAQGSIAGVVKDASGAVLPGVTVEAASPVLIEKVRTAVTDGAGQYRILNLRPGSYSVTFTLPGFATVRREDIELTGAFTATVNADLRVGGVEETITVSGETPVVDVQNVNRQQVLDRELIDAIPTGRNLAGETLLTPGVGGLEVGGGNFRTDTLSTTVHGSTAEDHRTTQNGVPVSVAFGGGQNFGQNSNVVAYEEVAVDTGAASAEIATGGTRFNLIPRDGGNSFSGVVFGSIITEGMQGDNYTQELKDRGLATPDKIKQLVDINPGFGGPIMRDRLWFYSTYRYKTVNTYPPGIFYNRNANNPNLWTYEPDTSRRPSNDVDAMDAQLRITWQATPKHKLGFHWNEATNCLCVADTTATRTPDASITRNFPKMRNLFADWTAPLTNQMLLEAGMVRRIEFVTRDLPPESNPSMISVTDQGLGNLVYRAPPGPVRTTWYRTMFYRAAASYVAAGHAVKVGLTGGLMVDETTNFSATAPYDFRFNNGVPNQITLYAVPYDLTWNGRETGLYAQDHWTIGRLALSYGVRYDYYSNSFKDQHLRPGPLVPNRNVEFPDSTGVSWHDLTPKSGVAYDLFGNGKTALKVSLNKYLQGMGNGGVFGTTMAPVSLTVTSTTRAWTDTNRDFVPDCNLASPDANGECAAMANRAFGSSRAGSTYDPDTLTGWGKRGYNWEFSAGVQQEVLPRVAVDLGYFRRWYGNFVTTDNRAVSAADYDQFSLTAPANPGLPGGGGYVVSGLYDLNPSKFGTPADNFITFSDSFGKETKRWNGVDVILNARPRDGILLRGGVSSGRTSTDNCEIVTQLPEQLFGAQVLGVANANVWLPQANCSQTGAFLTQVKFLGSYTIPRVDVQISGGLQNVPGPEALANYAAPTAAVRTSLGRDLSGGARNVTVNLMEPGTVYGDRLTELDLRVGKLLRFGATRTNVMLEIYNVFNSSGVLLQSNTFGGATPWLQPQSIMPARFIKLGFQIDF